MDTKNSYTEKLEATVAKKKEELTAYNRRSLLCSALNDAGRADSGYRTGEAAGTVNFSRMIIHPERNAHLLLVSVREKLDDITIRRFCRNNGTIIRKYRQLR